MFRIIAFFLLFFSFFALNSAENDEIKMEINSKISDTVCSIGDKIHLNYFISFDSNLKIIKPQIPENIGEIEVLNFFYDTNQAFFHKLNITLIPFDSGIFFIPPMLFIFENPKTNKIYTKSSDNYKLTVNSINLGKNPKLQEISNKKLPEYSINYFAILIIFLIILLISATVAITIKIKRKYNKN